MTHLYLVRHADYIYDLVDGQYPKRNQGLSAEGVVQAEKLRDRLARTGEIKPEVFISSAERGAYETANIIAPVLNLEATLDKDFEEWRSEDGTISDEEFFGLWNKTPNDQKPYIRFVEGCETWLEFSVRACQALNRVVQTHPDKTILVMTHGAFIQVSFMYFFGMGEVNLRHAMPDVKRTSITHWYKSKESSRWILERSNDYAHLAG